MKLQILKTLVSSLLFILLSIVATSSVEIAERRAFDQDKIAEYHDDASFDYTSDYAKSGSLINLLLIYLLDKLASLFSATGLGGLWPYVWRILVVVVIVAVIFYILKYRYGSVLERRSQSFVPVGIQNLGNEKIDYNKLIAESREAGDYKLAIRYLFLKCLNELHQSEQIKITSWKAPLDYVHELPIAKQEPFTALVNLFEVTWYGDYQADEQGLKQSVSLVDQIGV